MMESKRLLFVARLGDGFVQQKDIFCPGWLISIFSFRISKTSSGGFAGVFFLLTRIQGYCTFCCFFPQRILRTFSFSRTQKHRSPFVLGNSHICNDHDSGRMVGVGANLLELWQTENYNTANLYICHKHQQIKCIPHASCMDDLPTWKVKKW